jgi:class 3 adenylate cyclase/tetratricopeptide (TPR) repeat protein
VDFVAVVDQAIALLRQRGRVAYRTLKRHFQLDDEALEDLKIELIDSQRLATDEQGTVLVWAGEVASPAVPTAVPAPVSVPLTYTPSYLAEKILTSRSALEGERKQVTVLFADLKGSMELLAERDPEEARQLLDPVLERMMAAVHRYEGTVNQVMGDGIMALFGAPLAHEDHAVRACYAALAMQAAVKQYAAEVQRTYGVPVQIRVGLNAGEVVVRAIGSDLHMDYTAVGQTTHLAARMEQMAIPGTILLTPAVLRLAEGFVQVTPVGPVPIKGLAEPVEVFELRGATALRRRLQTAVARGLSPFVGRQPELEALQQAMAQAEAGHGQIVAAVGEAGVGKSRLVYEVVHSHRTQGWRVLESASVSYGKAIPYFPVLDLLKHYVQVEDRDDTRTIRARVTGQVLTLDPALQETIPALLALLDALPEESPFLTLDPPQRRRHTLDGLKRVLLRESQVQPLLLVFEDLHWIDTETQAPLTQLLMARTEGNPFFLEESVRTLEESGVLLGTPGAYRLAQAVPSIQVPATVQAVLAARIDRLPPEEKHLLQTAAVLGMEVPLPLLQAIAEVPEEALHRGLAHLQVAEFLYETRLFPEHTYTFKHALTHEVAYSSLLLERRRVLHARIVEALEAFAGDRVAEEVERLAHHAVRGEAWAKALAYCRQAGEKTLARSAHRQAVGYFDQALSALLHLPETRDTITLAIDLRLALRTALRPLGDFGRILTYLHEAEALAVALDDPRRLAQVSLFLAVQFRLMGAYDQAIAAAQRALVLAMAGGEVVLHALANQYLGFAYQHQGDYRRAIDCLGQTVASIEGASRRERFGQVFLPAVQSRVQLVWCHAELGMFAEGRVLGNEGLRIAEAVAHPASLMFASWGIGLLALRQGELSRAVPPLERAVSLCQDTDLPVWFPWMAAALGTAYTLDGHVADAVPLLTQATEQSIATEMIAFQAPCDLSLGEAQLLAGRLEEAHALAERALAHAREHQERGNQTYALRLLGDITAHRTPPDVDAAATHYRQALALAKELGMRPLQAHCHRGLGTLYSRTGQSEQASAELSTAIDMYRDMEMTFWLPQAEVALEQLKN